MANQFTTTPHDEGSALLLTINEPEPGVALNDAADPVSPTGQTKMRVEAVQPVSDTVVPVVPASIVVVPQLIWDTVEPLASTLMLVLAVTVVNAPVEAEAPPIAAPSIVPPLMSTVVRVPA